MRTLIKIKEEALDGGYKNASCGEENETQQKKKRVVGQELRVEEKKGNALYTGRRRNDRLLWLNIFQILIN